MQKAELKWKELVIREKNFNPSRFASSARPDSTDVKEVDARMKEFVDEYLHLAFKHRALPEVDTLLNGTRMAVLYERAAELVCLLRKEETTDTAFVGNLIDQNLKLVDMLNVSEEVSKEDIVVRERICEYGSLALAAPHQDIQALWKKANDLLSRSVAHGLSAEKGQTGGSAARLYACAAQADNNAERLCFASAARACEECFGDDKQSDEDEYDSLADSSDEESVVEYHTRFILYHHLLAGTVLALGEVSSALPAELVTFFAQAQQQSAEVDGLKGMAEEHATYIVLKNRCVHQCAQLPAEDPALDAWQAAQREVDVLLSLFHQRAENSTAYNQTGHQSRRILFQELVVKCHVAFAEAPSDSASAVAWKKAVDTCRDSVLASAESAKALEDAIAIIEIAVEAAQAKVGLDVSTDYVVGKERFGKIC